MSDNTFDVSTIEFVSLDGVIKLWFNIIQIGWTSKHSQESCVILFTKFLPILLYMLPLPLQGYEDISDIAFEFGW